MTEKKAKDIQNKLIKYNESYETKSKCITDNSGINCKQDSKEYYKYTFKNELNLNVYNYYVSN